MNALKKWFSYFATPQTKVPKPYQWSELLRTRLQQQRVAFQVEMWFRCCRLQSVRTTLSCARAPCDCGAVGVSLISCPAVPRSKDAEKKKPRVLRVACKLAAHINAPICRQRLCCWSSGSGSSNFSFSLFIPGLIVKLWRMWGSVFFCWMSTNFFL